MLKKCETLLAQLQESLALAQDIEKASGTNRHTDVTALQMAIDAVKARIGYLKKWAADKKGKPVTNQEPAPAADNGGATAEPTAQPVQA